MINFHNESPKMTDPRFVRAELRTSVVFASESCKLIHVDRSTSGSVGN